MIRTSDPIAQTCRLRARACLTAVTLAIAACTSVSSAPDPAAQNALAPSGKLRVGLYPGTPTSIIGDPSTSQRGVGFELGKALAMRTAVPFEPVVFANNAAVQAAAKSGEVDMVFTNATPARMKDLDFSPTVLQVEQGYLVPAASTIRSIADVDRPGVRVGVSEGSTSEAVLSSELHQATVVRTATLKSAVDMLNGGKLGAFATNKATLFEMSDQMPGSRVLAGHWGLESFAIGIPKGRDAAMRLVAGFVSEAKASGLVAGAVERAGLRGIAPSN